MQNVFKRRESKYLLNKTKYTALIKLVSEHMTPDEFACYTVNNIYFDNDAFELISRSIEKPVFKEKLRLRVYQKPSDDSKAYLELKKKYDGIVYKRRITARLDELERYINHGEIIEDSQILREIEYLYKKKNLKPKLYLAYEREAFCGKDDDAFRMTFDKNIRFRYHDLDIRNQNGCQSLLQDGLVVAEIKCPLAYPRWLLDYLRDYNVYKTSFSKYGNVHIKKMEENKETKECSA